VQQTKVTVGPEIVNMQFTVHISRSVVRTSWNIAKMSWSMVKTSHTPDMPLQHLPVASYVALPIPAMYSTVPADC